MISRFTNEKDFQQAFVKKIPAISRNPPNLIWRFTGMTGTVTVNAVPFPVRFSHFKLIFYVRPSKATEFKTKTWFPSHENQVLPLRIICQCL